MDRPKNSPALPEENGLRNTGSQTSPDAAVLEALLPRYSMAGPRYTSYPTAPAWKEELESTDYKEILDTLPHDGTTPHAIYVHVPFCRNLCHFCACNRVITKNAELPPRFLETVTAEIREVRRHLPEDSRSGQIHLGGGTPTYLTPPQLEQLMEAILESFPAEEGAEISVEIDPRVTSDDHMDTLKAYGFNRISLGVQDFDPRVQDAIHRHQSVDQVNHLVERARNDGVEGVNFDLIYGLPHQTPDSFQQTIDHVTASRPDRIALYGYAHVTWVAKQQRGFERIDLPDPSARLSLFIQATEQLLGAGYMPIGMDHFVLPSDDLARALPEDRVHRNFMGYTTRPCGELFAFGPSGISELSMGFVQNERDLAAWESRVAQSGLAAFRGHRLSEDDKRRGWVIAQIMCGARLSADRYRELYAEDFLERFSDTLPQLESFQADGLLELGADGGFTITPTGRMFIRNIAMPFDAYLPKQQEDGKPMFSRTV